MTRFASALIVTLVIVGAALVVLDLPLLHNEGRRRMRAAIRGRSEARRWCSLLATSLYNGNDAGRRAW
jgi:hypothetical protein